MLEIRVFSKSALFVFFFLRLSFYNFVHQMCIKIAIHFQKLFLLSLNDTVGLTTGPIPVPQVLRYLSYDCLSSLLFTSSVPLCSRTFIRIPVQRIQFFPESVQWIGHIHDFMRNAVGIQVSPEFCLISDSTKACTPLHPASASKKYSFGYFLPTEIFAPVSK